MGAAGSGRKAAGQEKAQPRMGAGGDHDSACWGFPRFSRVTIQPRNDLDTRRFGRAAIQRAEVVRAEAAVAPTARAGSKDGGRENDRGWR